jgi:hypothetical protein
MGDHMLVDSRARRLSSGKAELRYTDGKFQQNWTPKTKGCPQVTVATTDGATLTADFVLR